MRDDTKNSCVADWNNLGTVQNVEFNITYSIYKLRVKRERFLYLTKLAGRLDTMKIRRLKQTGYPGFLFHAV